MIPRPAIVRGMRGRPDACHRRFTQREDPLRTIPEVSELHYDFISHLVARFGISEDVVSARLGEWLLDIHHDNRRWQQELVRR